MSFFRRVALFLMFNSVSQAPQAVPGAQGLTQGCLLIDSCVDCAVTFWNSRRKGLQHLLYI